MRVQILVAAAALLMSVLTAYAVSDRGEDRLATPESFASIDDAATRSAAFFTELGKVLTNPRCVNCHPAGDRPRQGELGRTHQPPVERGADGFGLPAMRCPICHQQANFDAGAFPATRIGISRRQKWRGKARRSVRFARRSRTVIAMAAGLWKRSRIISAPTLWLAGPGCPGSAVDPRPAHNSKRARWSTHG